MDPQINSGNANEADSFVNGLGASISDLNDFASNQLNEDFALAEQLPYGKFISDFLGIATCYCAIENACKGSEGVVSNFAPAPINSLPTNPFTGAAHDSTCLLETINILTEESERDARRAAYGHLTTTYKSCMVPPHQVLRNVYSANQQIQQTLAYAQEELDRPQVQVPHAEPYISRVAREKPKDAGLLEALLAAAQATF